MTADKQETPRTDSVICPNCAHQFQAISMDHQAELAALRASIEAAELPEEPFWWWASGSVSRHEPDRDYEVVEKRDYDKLRAHADALQSKLSAAYEAATSLYFAGYWHCDRPVDEVALWTALRDACGIAPGQTGKLLGPDLSTIAAAGEGK